MEIFRLFLKLEIDCPDDLKVIGELCFSVNFSLFCLRYGHVILLPASGSYKC
ncbi:hypothetical protein SLEP1_g35047 [Rubroshorea leprosula]|uniref:Uncharacterized protein n=1 Tax=Rubroshorea leprosula TaxID=152421 RepID=A0AAV5KM19_9ROSI|nr:hypothetical protein SLEP1_g35047 [Rubroshorea leprosula]